MKLSIVVPVYNEAKNIPEFYLRITPVLSKVTSDFEIIFAMDPSTDESEEILIRLNRADPKIKYLKFSRRFGQPMATLAGLRYSTGDAVIVIDVDLQDPPELITEMIEKYREGFDVVYAQRRSRKGETLIKRVVANLGYPLINHIADVYIPPDTGDFRLMSRRVVDELVRLKESHGFLRGMVAVVGFKQTAVQFDRSARFQGKGNYSRFFGSLRIGLNGVFGFSNAMLSLSSILGFSVAIFSFLMAIAYLVLKFIGTPFPLGNPTIVILVLFIGGLQLISIGILGEYLGRIYDEIKQRPKFIVDHAVGLTNSSPTK